MDLRTVADTIAMLPSPPCVQLEAPIYNGQAVDSRMRMALAVEDMKRHMTDEGWQIMQGLQCNGYALAGYNLVPYNTTDVSELMDLNPGVVVVQDKREWDLVPNDFRERRAYFTNVDELAMDEDRFKVTILKDSHQRPPYHIESAVEMGVHAWIIYYHPKIVCRLAPYVRPQHLIRTYHSVDRLMVPPYSQLGRSGTLISGAVSGAYPLRARIIDSHKRGLLPGVTYHRHPGYHNRGCHTPEFLKLLSRFKVAICTSSIYGYALRKIIEATACGCVVVTDLPTDEVMPAIDDNLVRVPNSASVEDVYELTRHLESCYNADRQEDFSVKARRWYDYREVGKRLADDIETMRRLYGANDI